MQGLGFTEAWLMAAGKQLIWQRFLQAKHRKRAKSLQTPEDGAADQVGFEILQTMCECCVDVVWLLCDCCVTAV